MSKNVILVESAGARWAFTNVKKAWGLVFDWEEFSDWSYAKLTKALKEEGSVVVFSHGDSINIEKIEVL